jgi:hypothetical protein
MAEANASLPPKRYHFHLVCPRCGKLSATAANHRVPSPHVNCGDCLMDAIEIIEMKVVKIEEAMQ